jgi:epsilon-lactone hydrolase
MASVQANFLKFLLKRQHFFGNGDYDPQATRKRMENSSHLMVLHRDVRVVPALAGTVPAEWLIPRRAAEDRVVLYIHGGAWFMGSAATHRGLVSNIAYQSETRALSLNYRLAPENPFPAGLDDCIAAYQWLLNNGISAKRIVVAGDSAGGNLTLALLVALRDADKPLPAGAVALSPVTDLAFTGASIKTRAHLDPILANLGSDRLIPDYITSYDPHHPYISPLYADLRGLPPVLIHVGDLETLLDDAVRFGERLRAAGVPAQVVVWPEMFHVFQIFVPLMPEASRAVKEIAKFIRTQLENSAG